MSLPTPKHIAIIPDGNRRWAKSKHLPSLVGHKKGVEITEEICDVAIEQGVKVLTFWAFSTENWKRSEKEVKYLFHLLEEVFLNKVDKFHRENIRLIVSGRIEKFPKKLQGYIRKAVAKTKNNTRGILNICLNYGGRTEIVDAVKKIIKNKIPAAKIDKETIQKNLYSPELPDPDLIIRTSGEHRTSGYLLWQSEYAEYVFVDKYWPDFTKKDLIKAITEFKNRQRRFGGT
ncbi:MAG: polyprenyl diphosphate synthase [bacterium]